MADDYSNVDALTAQCRKVSVPALSDTVDLAKVPKALWVTGTGNIVGIAADDTTAQTYAVTAGMVFDFVRFKRILATGTTATLLAGY